MASERYNDWKPYITYTSVNRPSPCVTSYACINISMQVCPLGPYYLPSYAQGVRTGIKVLGPHLIGLDPTEIARVNDVMDFQLKGHPYVKSALDMACWDILGKVAPDGKRKTGVLS